MMLVSVTHVVPVLSVLLAGLWITEIDRVLLLLCRGSVNKAKKIFETEESHVRVECELQ